MTHARGRTFFLLLTAATVVAAATPEQAFRAGNARAMQAMMTAMDAPPSGDVDVDFVNAMVPHHQGAVDMALLELRYGRNAQLRRIAQGIIVEQRQEIDAMQRAIGRSQTAPESVK